MSSMKQYENLPALEKLKALADALDETANRCDGNMLLAKTWVQESLIGAAQRAREIYRELKGQ